MLKQPTNLDDEICALATNDGVNVAMAGTSSFVDMDPTGISLKVDTLESVLPSKQRKTRFGLVQERIISVSSTALIDKSEINSKINNNLVHFWFL